jgi:hypothetical protein
LLVGGGDGVLQPKQFRIQGSTPMFSLLNHHFMDPQDEFFQKLRL